MANSERPTAADLSALMEGTLVHQEWHEAVDQLVHLLPVGHEPRVSPVVVKAVREALDGELSFYFPQDVERP